MGRVEVFALGASRKEGSRTGAPIITYYREVRLLIKRIQEIEALKVIESDFQRSKGYAPQNVSTWLTSSDFNKTMSKVIDVPFIEDPIEYFYTYSWDDSVLESLLIKLLGREQTDTFATCYPNTTIAIVNVANLMRAIGVKRIAIITPAYFSIKHVVSSYGIEYVEYPMVMRDGILRLPIDELRKSSCEAIWVTSPVFSTSQYLVPEDIDFLGTISKKFIITDESFCLPGNELLRWLLPSENVIGIYSPHKAICINSVKFSVIVAPARLADLVYQWVDILAGNLSGSTRAAVEHYLTKNYDQCLSEFLLYMARSRKALEEATSARNDLKCNIGEIGSLYTIYHENAFLPKTLDLDFQRRLVFETGVSVYSGILNDFPASVGYCYRVNLGIADQTTPARLIRLWDYLLRYSS